MSTILNPFANTGRGIYNLVTLPFNGLADVAALPTDIARSLGASEETIEEINFALLMMPGVGGVNMMSEMSTAARAETEINEVAAAAKIETNINKVATATKIETNVTEVNAGNRLEKLATVADSGQVKWVAGDAELFQASQQANAAARTTATGRYGFNLFRSRFLNRLLNRANLSGPIHHWNFPIKQFATQATDAENLYLLGGAKLHLELHQAIGLEGAPLKAMALAEREIQSMFNFWSSGLKLEDTWKHLSPLGPYPAR